jgi:hypothetical protein
LKAHVVHQLPTKDRRAAAGIKIGPISHQAATANACWISVLRYGLVLLFKLIAGIVLSSLTICSQQLLSIDHRPEPCKSDAGAPVARISEPGPSASDDIHDITTSRAAACQPGCRPSYPGRLLPEAPDQRRSIDRAPIYTLSNNETALCQNP